MVKISELSDKQLVGQLEKYQKILDQLTVERQKRISKGTNKKVLLTKKERAELKKQAEMEKEADEFQLQIDDEEIEKINEEVAAKDNKEEEEDEEVRVTQLLTLSKEQLAELKKAKKK